MGDRLRVDQVLTPLSLFLFLYPNPYLGAQTKYVQAAADATGNEAIVRKLVLLEKYEDALGGDYDEGPDDAEEGEESDKRRVNFRVRAPTCLALPFPTRLLAPEHSLPAQSSAACAAHVGKEPAQGGFWVPNWV